MLEISTGVLTEILMERRTGTRLEISTGIWTEVWMAILVGILAEDSTELDAAAVGRVRRRLQRPKLISRQRCAVWGYGFAE